MERDAQPNLEQIKEAVMLEKDLAEKAVDDGELELAWVHLKQAISRLSFDEMDKDCNALLISTTIEYQNTCISLGKDLVTFAPYLKRAKAAAEAIGDQRSRALILLHLGRFYNYHGSKTEALAYFEEGKSEVEKLGDEDILDQSAELMGFYYQIRGLYLDALPRFERAAQIYESAEKGLQLNPMGPVSLAYCYAFLGRFHNAIGTLDYYRQLAIERSDHALATTMRAIMGMVLLLINNKEEAFHELSGAYQDAKKIQNDIAYYFASGYLSYYKLLDGDIQGSWNALSKHTRQGKKTGLYQQYESPMKIEHIHELVHLGLEPVPGLNYKMEMERYLLEPNIHLRGVALRISAMDEYSKNKNHETVEEKLEHSEVLLKRSGDPVQLAKTQLEIARLKLKKNNTEAARCYAQKAWHGFSGYGDLFFPDNMRYLLIMNDPDRANQTRQEELAEKFLSMMQDLAPSADMNDMMAKTVKATNRFFGAERGGLFWFNGNQNSIKPILRGSNNLNQREIFSEAFRPNLDFIIKAFQKKTPQIARLDGGEARWPHQTRAILCLPFEVSGQTRGVLYHDNSYIKDCFDFLEKPMLSRLEKFLSSYVEQVYNFSQRMEHLAAEKSCSDLLPDKNTIIAESAVMKRLIEQVDRVALSDSSVVILGETGVGKELLAHRIHKMSKRTDGPFIIVDSTTIPEELFESELFGYEKGAFTGANHSKAGRLELAHNGTLFIDEIGEIPKTLQVKLLRVLQEKTLIRLGGKRTISSNFRLVVATNRDLVAEVSAGRFREDLYFRLNVVPVTLPPLRERPDDLPLLARHFLARYAAKYNRPIPELTSEDEARLFEYHWPGNIRELQNVLERAVILSMDEELVIDLPVEKAFNSRQFFDDFPSMEELQRRYIRFAMEKTGGKVGGPRGTAELLGMKRTTLQKRMNKLGIKRFKS